MAPWNMEPKMAGDIWPQSKERQSRSVRRILPSKAARRSWPLNRPPFMYWNCAIPASSTLSPAGSSRAWNSSASLEFRSEPSSLDSSTYLRKLSWGKMPVSSAKRQKGSLATQTCRSSPE
jgi:hypothetical protein